MSTHALVDAYATAVSEGDFDRLSELIHADASFGGTVMTEAEGLEAFIQGFRNLRPITLRTDVHSVVVETIEPRSSTTSSPTRSSDPCCAPNS
jgi:hypothetical protein